MKMRDLHRSTIQAFIILEAAKFSIGLPAINSEINSYNNMDTRLSTIEAQPRGMSGDHDMVEKPKSKPWLGYYDFLITEGSYKFWVVFELFTVALLIYSAFAALYYAKYTIADTDYDYDDYFFKKRSSRSIKDQQWTLWGLTPQTYLTILQAITDSKHKYS